GRLDFTGTQTLSGNGAVIFGSGVNSLCNALRVTQSGTTLTLGPGITVRGHTGQIGWENQCVGGPSDISVVNQGTISADVAGGTIYIRAQPFTNNGLIRSPGGTVNLAGTIVSGGLGTFQSAGGNVLLTGLLENTNGNLRLDGPGNLLMLQGGTLHGGTIT